MKRLAIIALTIMVLLAGCGYGFKGMGSAPGGIHTVNVPIVENATTYSELTNALTNELIRLFNQSDILKVTGPNGADSILEAKIVSVAVQGAARDNTGTASAARRAVMVVEARLIKKSDGAVLWDSGRVVGRRTYQVQDEQSGVRASLSKALLQISLETADKIHSGIFEDF